MSILVVKDSSNNKLRELECTATGLLKVELPDVSALALESSLSSLNGKVTAVNTGACVVSACALPTGAATEATASANGGSLATLAGAVSGGVVQVSAPTPSGSNATTVFSAVVVGAASSVKSTAKDVDLFKSVCIMGNTTNVADTTVEIEVSNDNITFFELNNSFITVDMTSGDFGIQLDLSAKYVRLSKTNSQVGSETITAIISAK